MAGGSRVRCWHTERGEKARVAENSSRVAETGGRRQVQKALNGERRRRQVQMEGRRDAVGGGGEGRLEKSVAWAEGAGQAGLSCRQ